MLESSKKVQQDPKNDRSYLGVSMEEQAWDKSWVPSRTVMQSSVYVRSNRYHVDEPP
jgi:hypothetical protein